MHRGEVWWAKFSKPRGQRPVLLLSRDSAYQVRSHVIVAPVTKTIRSIPTEVKLGREDGLPSRCVVNLDDIITVPKSLIDNYVTSLSPEKMEEVKRAIFFALDLDA